MAEIIKFPSKAACEHANGITACMEAGRDDDGDPWVRISGTCEDCGATVQPSWEPDARTIGAILTEAFENCIPGEKLRGERLIEIIREGTGDEDGT